MKPIDKPWEQLEKAASFIEAMKSSKSLPEYEQNWKEFLHNLERAWNKLTSHLKRSPKYQGWNERGRTEKIRRQDPLLCYLVNARGADEHSVEDITRSEPGGIGINPASGRALHINKLEMKNSRMTIDSDQPIKIVFVPGKIRLLPVANRGRTYPTPTAHLDKDLDSNDPIKIAELGVEFYRDYFKKAEAYFVK
jgi:hypothetical protein